LDSDFSDILDRGEVTNSRLLREHFETVNNALRTCKLNQGIYFSVPVAKWILQQLDILSQEVIYNKDSFEGQLEDWRFLAAQAGNFLQAFHHCQNGQMEGIMKALPALLVRSDLEYIDVNLDEILSLIMKLLADKIMGDVLKFGTEHNGIVQVSGESVTYFLGALSYINGNYGINFVESDVIPWFNGKMLLCYLKRNCKYIYDSLIDADGNLTPEVKKLEGILDVRSRLSAEEIRAGLMKILETAISPKRVINLMLTDDFLSITKIALRKYVEDLNRAGRELVWDDIIGDNFHLRRIVADMLIDKKILLSTR
jgi:hypothetical protein